MQSSFEFRLSHCVLPVTRSTARYTLSLHDALPICSAGCECAEADRGGYSTDCAQYGIDGRAGRCAGRACCSSRCHRRSEEHTSELQSRRELVCRLLLEKKYDSEHH